MGVAIVFGYDANIEPGSEGRKRVEKAVKLYKEGVVDKIILTGEVESKLMKAYCLEEGVREKDILVECFSRSTMENLWYSRELFSKLLKGRRIYLVSSEWHGERIEKLASHYLKDYTWEFIPVESEKPHELEKFKLIFDQLLLKVPVLRDRPDVVKITLKRLAEKLFSRIYRNWA